MMKHIQAYIICATPRSGSTLLCDLLADTGVAGHPDSFFRRQSFAEWAHYFNVSTSEWRGEHEFDQPYLAAILKEGSGGSQIFGMRLMWESVSALSKRLECIYPGMASDSARFQFAFGPVLYVHLSREDKIAQAVSRLRAEQTGLWHVSVDGTERERTKPGDRPLYDSNRLSEIVAELSQHDAAWASWFTRERIQPVRITYETLSTRPQAVLARMLSALSLDPGLAGTVEPRTSKLAGSESREWASRFRTERQNMRA